MEFEKKKNRQTIELDLEKGSEKSLNKKPETVTSKSLELEKRPDNSENTITLTELQLNETDRPTQANETVKNVKGQFQCNPHKSKIHKQEIYSEKSPLQNVESNDDVEYQIMTEKEKSNTSDLENEENDGKDRNLKIDRLKCHKGTNKAENILEESSASSDEFLSLAQTRRRKKTHTRWTKEELKAVRTHFKDNIQQKTNPGKAKEFPRWEQILGAPPDHAEHNIALLSQLCSHLKFQLRTINFKEFPTWEQILGAPPDHAE
ncbi:unnamed protein product [Diatraea saccharalis]|uniref:Uncharacterized protein n=1 Tax=Diatraea saccharalis TaxID=40085 RepID=A0A9N9QL04_9NEOP|nr:unnamed protein product [Diatraea saccharalis]